MHILSRIADTCDTANTWLALSSFVAPAQAGVHNHGRESMDSRLRGNDRAFFILWGAI